jgi:ABC-2 type transport system ATP-binding protein
VDEVVDLVGLGQLVRRRAGRFSLGMDQRLGIATPLLGNPPTILLDEPLNGLDTEGVRWVRSLLGELAAEGRTAFVSSHLMNEMALTAQHLIVIGRGRLIADTGVGRLRRPGRERRRTGPQHRSARARRPAPLPGGGRLTGRGRRPDRVRAQHRPGRPHRRAAGITLLELTAKQVSLEDAFMTVTRDAVEFRAATTLGADQ